MERQALTQQDPDYSEGFRGTVSDQQVPWKAIYLAAGLLVAGVVLLFTGVGLWATDPAAHGQPAVVNVLLFHTILLADHRVGVPPFCCCRVCTFHTWASHVHTRLLLLPDSILCIQRSSRIFV